MEDKHLHIITHDVPWPVDYGGVVDLFYKIKALHHSGVKIHLHCFVNKRPAQEELEKYCHQVHYYKRYVDLNHFSFRLPFIVNSRKNDDLIANLVKDNYPILLEGIHCSYYLHVGKLVNRTVLLRLHNTEFEYYQHLATIEKNPLKKCYFLHESKLLKKYEKQLAGKVKIAAVSDQDVKLYKELFNADNIAHLPVFVPYTMAAGKQGKGCFCLYHGNLSINENEEAAIWLLENVFDQLEIPFVIAGKDPSQKLSFMAHEHPHTCLVANPCDKELQDMIAKAQINILPSLNNTGVKLKLLNALFNGRHCLVNKAGVEGSGLDSICQIAEDADDFKTAISYLYNIPFDAEENKQRQQLLHHLYCNQKNVQKVMDEFWPSEIN
ncbi:MAG: putative mannosyltransferase [Ferruginibacter sp.]|nr:putative mannosyltransferase [Ferruginibacter sp.]